MLYRVETIGCRIYLKIDTIGFHKNRWYENWTLSVYIELNKNVFFSIRTGSTHTSKNTWMFPHWFGKSCSISPGFGPGSKCCTASVDDEEDAVEDGSRIVDIGV